MARGRESNFGQSGGEQPDFREWLEEDPRFDGEDREVSGLTTYEKHMFRHEPMIPDSEDFRDAVAQRLLDLTIDPAFNKTTDVRFDFER